MNKVLIVDDSPTVLEKIVTILQKHGLVVQVAHDGIEAIEMLKQYHPDIVVLDIVMPRMNGYELCRRLKGDPKTQDVPVVICSEKGEEFDRYWAMKQGADAYIAKPFQEKELLATIKQLLNK